MLNQHEIGQRIARARRRRGLSQAVLAGLVNRSESWLSQVERGRRGIDSHAVLTRLAGILHTDIQDLTGPSDTPGTGHRYSHVSRIEQAMMGYDAISESIAPSTGTRTWNPANLLGRIESAYRAYQATRYEQTGHALPGIIRDVEAASRTSKPAHPAVCEARALAYDTATALLSRVGEHTLAWTAADRAIAAAEQSGRSLLTAFGSYRLAYVLANRQHPQRAVQLAATAADALALTMKTPVPEQISVLGGLYLAAASAAAANYDTTLTPSFLREARAAADRLGKDANLMRTGFGPINVAIHTMAASIRLGDSRTAITIGETLDARSLPPALVGRRTQIHLDLAHAYAMRRQDAASVNMLLAAEQISPQLVQFDERTREVITALLSREHRASTPGLRPLARRAGVA